MCDRAELLAWAPLQRGDPADEQGAFTSWEIQSAKSVELLLCVAAVGALTVVTARARPILAVA